MRPAKRMLEAEVQHHTLFAAARSHADRERNSRHYLQAAPEVVRPANAGADEKILAASGLSISRHFFRREPDRLQHPIHAVRELPDKRLPQVYVHRLRL